MTWTPEPLPEDRMARLPAYAQAQIIALTRRCAELQQELSDLVEPSQDVSTHSDPHGDHPKPVGNYPHLRHRLADGNELQLELQPYRVHVWVTSSGPRAPVAVPVVSNALDIVVLDDTAFPAPDKRKESQ